MHGERLPLRLLEWIFPAAGQRARPPVAGLTTSSCAAAPTLSPSINSEKSVRRVVFSVDNAEAHEVTVRADDTEFRARVRLDTPREREYLRHGGILQYVLRRLLAP